MPVRLINAQISSTGGIGLRQNEQTVQNERQQGQRMQDDGARNQPVPRGDPTTQSRAPKRRSQNQKNEEITCDRQAARILRLRSDNRQRQYLVRWEDSWELEENLTKLRRKFPCRVLTKRITAGIPYCNVRWYDTWELAQNCNDELIQRFNIARADRKRKIRNRPRPRHEHFLRSKISQSDQGKKPTG